MGSRAKLGTKEGGKLNQAKSAGIGIATNTSAIPALEKTLATAGSLVEASKLLKARAEEIGGIAVDLAASR